MLERLRGDLPSPGAEAARVRDLTRQVLRRAEFQPPRRTLLQAAWHWLASQFGRLLRALFGGTGQSAFGWASTMVVGVAALVVIVLVILTARRMVGSVAQRQRSPVVFVGHWHSRSAAEWRAEAVANEAQGRWREALRCRYRALLADLAGRGLVDEIPGRTSGEYRSDVATSVPQAAPAFEGATDLFEQAWYGDRPTGPADQSAFDELAQQVLGVPAVASRAR